MSRDPSKLKVFHLADELAVAVYRVTRGFPVEERYGLQAQLRRAAVSVPTNIVEGCARNSEKDYLHFIDVAIASASEVRYLLGLSARLAILQKADQEPLVRRYDDLIRSLQKLLSLLRTRPPTRPPEASTLRRAPEDGSGVRKAPGRRRNPPKIRRPQAR